MYRTTENPGTNCVLTLRATELPEVSDDRLINLGLRPVRPVCDCHTAAARYGTAQNIQQETSVSPKTSTLQCLATFFQAVEEVWLYETALANDRECRVGSHAAVTCGKLAITHNQTQTLCISPAVCDGARRTAETPVTGKRSRLVLSATSGRGPAHRGHAPLLIVTRADGVTARRCQRPLWKHFWKASVDT